MKKTYINPTIEVVNINTGVQLLAGSDLIPGGGSTDQNLSRELDFGDDLSSFDEGDDLAAFGE